MSEVSMMLSNIKSSTIASSSSDMELLMQFLLDLYKNLRKEIQYYYWGCLAGTH